MLCLMRIFLVYKEWFKDRVDSLIMWVQPKRTPCISLKNSFFGDYAPPYKNPVDGGLIWDLDHPYCKESVKIPHYVYMCSVRILPSVWEKKMKQGVNKADRVFFSCYDLQQVRRRGQKSSREFANTFYSSIKCRPRFFSWMNLTLVL